MTDAPPSVFLLIAASAGLCALFHVLIRHYFPQWNLLDFPERYGLTRKRLPYPSGIAAVATFLIFYPFIQGLDIQSLGVLIGVLLIALISFMDDRRPLPPLLRLSMQISVAILVFATGTRIYSLTNPLFFGGDILPLDRLTIPGGPFGPLPVMSGLFTIFWLGLTMNALNWFDGIPGQVSTLSTIAFLTIGLLSLSSRVDQPVLAAVCFLLAGTAAASMFFDFPPPKVVMGDTGAMFFGLMIGIVTIYAGGKVATAFLVLGVPLLDLISVFLRRILRGHSPIRGSRGGEHLHHLLLERGWTQRGVILLTAGIGSLFGITALFLTTSGKFIAGFILLLLMTALSFYAAPNSERK